VILSIHTTRRARISKVLGIGSNTPFPFAFSDRLVKGRAIPAMLGDSGWVGGEQICDA